MPAYLSKASGLRYAIRAGLGLIAAPWRVRVSCRLRIEEDKGARVILRLWCERDPGMGVCVEDIDGVLM